MKKILLNSAFLFLSFFAFGQKYVYLPDVEDDDFLEFLAELYMMESLELHFEPIKPTDTIQVMGEKYFLKYIEIENAELRFEDLYINEEGKIIPFSPSGMRYSLYKYGTDFLVIDLFEKPNEIVKETTYYYEIIKK